MEMRRDRGGGRGKRRRLQQHLTLQRAGTWIIQLASRRGGGAAGGGGLGGQGCWVCAAVRIGFTETEPTTTSFPSSPSCPIRGRRRGRRRRLRGFLEPPAPSGTSLT
eukprot:760377-Hanusia_phi.AAC.1